MYEYAARIVNVVDGDTVDAVVDVGFKIKVSQRLRLSRVDTPERDHPDYAKAKQFMQDLVLNKDVFIRTHKVSKWGYYLVDIIRGGRDVAEMLIAANLGKPYDGGKKQ